MRTIVATALTSRFPYLLWLGRRGLFMVYNDAYIPILGNRHPAALGERSERVWWDIWDSIGPLIASVIATPALATLTTAATRVHALDLFHRLAELLEEPVVMVGRQQVPGGDDQSDRPINEFQGCQGR